MSLAGQTFGSAVSQRRKAQRIRVQDLLQKIDATGRLTPDIWNEVEQDRLDPAKLTAKVKEALASVLQLDQVELENLIRSHYMARQQDRKFWSMITEEAHAFRRRRDQD